MPGLPDSPVASAVGQHELMARRIVDELLQCRRRRGVTTLSLDHEECLVVDNQQPRVLAFVARHATIDMVLPAFPAKSPNSTKVLGALPDLAERISLGHLHELCERIGRFYEPGARIVICSDGHVFADLIQVDDDTVNAYQQAMVELIAKHRWRSLSVFNLGDVASYRALAHDFDAMRLKLNTEFGQSLVMTREEILGHPEHVELYRAITRFMFEDGLMPGYRGSRTALQRVAKIRSLGVIQRSWAWGNLLAAQYPEAIRLSIHPQAPDSIKMGIHMMPTGDAWLTPWHGVALQQGTSITLVKRADAQAMGATLAYVNGVPSHYVAVADR